MSHVPESPERSMVARFQKFEDIEAIKQLKYQYALYVDELPKRTDSTCLEKLLDLFVEDAIASFTPAEPTVGRQALRQLYGEVVPTQVAWSRHHMLHPLIVVNGDVATGRWRLEAAALFNGMPAANPQTWWGSYHDEYTRTPTGWKFRSIKFEQDDPRGPQTVK